MKNIIDLIKSLLFWFKTTKILGLFSSLIVLLSGSPSLANATNVCDKSIELAARSTTVPIDILYKIARLESGRYVDGQFVSWPWSLNNAGESYFLDNFEESLEALVSLRDSGETNVDIGCMQLNLRWHGNAFDELSAMLSPLGNVAYASSYLEKLFAETGSWEQAIKYYHSRNSKFNEVYFSKFQEIKLPSVLETPIYEVVAYLDGNLPKIINFFSNQSTSKIYNIKKPALNAASLYGKRPASFESIRDFSVAPLVEM